MDVSREPASRTSDVQMHMKKFSLTSQASLLFRSFLIRIPALRYLSIIIKNICVCIYDVAQPCQNNQCLQRIAAAAVVVDVAADEKATDRFPLLNSYALHSSPRSKNSPESSPRRLHRVNISYLD